jgi:AcrR family transcriptional regulator
VLIENLTQTDNSQAGAPMRRGERRKQHTKRRLLDAAAETYAVSSVEQATISAITERADVGLGTFYLHFEDKDSIASAVSGVIIRRILVDEGIAVEAVRSVGGEPDPLAILARVLCTHGAENPGLLSALLRWEGPANTSARAHTEFDVAPEALIGFRAALLPELQKRFVEGTNRDLYRIEDSDLAAQALLGLFASTIPSWVSAGRSDWSTLASFLERTVLSMFRR